MCRAFLADKNTAGASGIHFDTTGDETSIISETYSGPLYDYDGSVSTGYSISIENGERFFKDTTGESEVKLKTELKNDGNVIINYSDVMRKTSEETKKTGFGSGISYTIRTGNNGAKLYYAFGSSGNYFRMMYDGSDALSWTGYNKVTRKGEEYYNVNSSYKLTTPVEISLSPNMEYNVNYVIENSESERWRELYTISITGTEIPGGDDPGKDDPGQGDPGQTVSENARTLVVKNKSSITKLFSKYGESGYKYRFKVEDKAQRKIARVTRKGKIRVKRSGKVKVSLFRKVKGGVWSKIEEQEIKTEKPIVKTKVTDLKVGDTLEASSFITNQKDLVNKPTSYVSTNTKVATVEYKTGKIKILKKGSTKIKMIYGAEKGAAVYKTRLKVNQ